MLFANDGRTMRPFSDMAGDHAVSTKTLPSRSPKCSRANEPATRTYPKDARDRLVVHFGHPGASITGHGAEDRGGHVGQSKRVIRLSDLMVAS
jgi:hypothetical protein